MTAWTLVAIAAAMTMIAVLPAARLRTVPADDGSDRFWLG